MYIYIQYNTYIIGIKELDEVGISFVSSTVWTNPALANCCTTYFKMFGGACEALKAERFGVAFDMKNGHFNMFNEENHLLIPYNSMNTYH